MERMAKRKQPRRGSRHVDRQSISLRSEDYELLRAMAEQNGRPMTWEIRMILRKAYRDAGSPPPAPPPPPSA